MMLGQPALRQSAAQQPLPDGPKPQQIPDAPRPQGLPVGPVTPGRGTTVDSNGDASPASTSEENAVPSKLADSTAQKPDDGQQPELPAPGEGQKAFTLVVR